MFVLQSDKLPANDNLMSFRIIERCAGQCERIPPSFPIG